MDLFDTIVRLETNFWNLVERGLIRDGQVGLGTLQALRVLDGLGGQGRVQDLSRELSITVGAASKLVDRLELNGLAARRTHPGDRRSSLISLTVAGTQACRDGVGAARRIVDSVVGRVNDTPALIAALEDLDERVSAERRETPVRPGS